MKQKSLNRIARIYVYFREILKKYLYELYKQVENRVFG